MNKDRLYFENTKRISRLKREIDAMYVELELQFNNDGLTQMENQLSQDKRKLQAEFDYTRKELKVRAKEQNKVNKT